MAFGAPWEQSVCQSVIKLTPQEFPYGSAVDSCIVSAVLCSAQQLMWAHVKVPKFGIPMLPWGLLGGRDS